MAGELNKKQPVHAALGDIVSQLTKMSDENTMSAADSSVRQLGDELNELIDRINSRKTSLQVSCLTYCCQYYQSTYIALLDIALPHYPV